MDKYYNCMLLIKTKQSQDLNIFLHLVWFWFIVRL